MSAFWVFLSEAWAWLKEHWYVPLFAAGAVLGFAVSASTRKKGPPKAQVKAELEVIKAGAKAKKLEAELGAAKATAEVEAEYHAEKERLGAAERAEAEKLRENPRDLARFLVRAGRK